MEGTKEYVVFYDFICATADGSVPDLSRCPESETEGIKIVQIVAFPTRHLFLDRYYVRG
ncbi:hypothetical protein D3C73_607480 [compost metagenome]